MVTECLVGDLFLSHCYFFFRKLGFITENLVNPYPANNVFVLKMLSAFYICCIYLNALRQLLVIEANIMNPDQTAPLEAV